MKQIVWILVLGSVLFGSNQYFLHQEVAIPKEFFQQNQEKEHFSIKIKPVFLNPHSYNQGALIYDLYRVTNHQKKLKG